MKVWLYYRLSRDEDDELNSLTNQRKIISTLCIYRAADRKRSPGGLILRGEKHRRSSGLNGAAKKSGIRTKPVTVSSYGHMPV